MSPKPARCAGIRCYIFDYPITFFIWKFYFGFLCILYMALSQLRICRPLWIRYAGLLYFISDIVLSAPREIRLLQLSSIIAKKSTAFFLPSSFILIIALAFNIWAQAFRLCPNFKGRLEEPANKRVPSFHCPTSFYTIYHRINVYWI